MEKCRGRALAAGPVRWKQQRARSMVLAPAVGTAGQARTCGAWQMASTTPPMMPRMLMTVCEGMAAS